MSHYDYLVSQEVAALDAPFNSLIMAAYRKADTFNAETLRMAFPEVTSELIQRYNAPGGLLAGEDRT